MPGPYDGAEVLLSVNMAEPTNASLTTGATNAAFTITADEYGTGGNSITRTIVDPAGNNNPLEVVVDGLAITINLESDGTGTPISTASEVVDAINNDPAAKFLVTASLPATSNGTGVVAVAASAPLAGGAAAGADDFQPVARQQGLDLDDSMDEIDADSKGDRFSLSIPGRQSGSFDLDMLQTWEDDSQQRLRRAYLRRESLRVNIIIPGTVTGGSPQIEEAPVRITSFGRSFPDSDVATFSASFSLQGPFAIV